MTFSITIAKYLSKKLERHLISYCIEENAKTIYLLVSLGSYSIFISLKSTPTNIKMANDYISVGQNGSAHVRCSIVDVISRTSMQFSVAIIHADLRDKLISGKLSNIAT